MPKKYNSKLPYPPQASTSSALKGHIGKGYGLACRQKRVDARSV